MIKEDLFALFNIEDIMDLPQAVMNTLMGDQNDRDIVYMKLLELNNKDVSYDWFQKLYEAELAQRKNDKQEFTPNTVGDLCSKLIGIEKGSVHEPTAGTGGMIIADWWNKCLQTLVWNHLPSENIVTCWELSSRAIPILLLNLSIRGIMGYVYHGDVLTLDMKTKYILLNRYDNTLGFSDIIEDEKNKFRIHKMCV